MKNIFTFFFCVFVALNAKSQVIDTILFENFQIDPFPAMELIPNGNDTVWVNCDEDVLDAITQLDEDRRWTFSEFYFEALDSLTGETNYCASSYSYLLNSLPGNRNWLITPPIQVEDANFTLHWKSASYQMPRYLDGYLVMVSEGSNDLYNGAFTDTLFQAASMVEITGNGQSLDLSNFTFTPGYIHANGVTDATYFLEGSGIAYGLLEPHSVSLAAYAGKTIYLAFLHNSDDDNLLALDDILVTRVQTSGISEADLADLRFVTFPNPVQSTLNVMFRLKEPSIATLRISDVEGRVLHHIDLGRLNAGEQQQNLELRQLPRGQYFISIQAGETIATRAFSKQ